MTTLPDDDTAAGRWTRLVTAVSALVGGAMLPGGVVAVRVTLADTRSTLASCEAWVATSARTWMRRGEIDVDGVSMPDLERALVAAGFAFPLTEESRPRWRVDRNNGTTYTLDVTRARA
ncbi:hypothetical protein [Myceligenerans pegani]|uniref:Uncharacterized protein n=1 Tax=Myceligenerans pegani TaxID=2776917 RepID=A0ABR9MVX0_9MICO|nr:hypothetical protein [Myceligenerans sp. TRM 65318]MBE1875540.1 hypothetical protein [Myceligenerans sp. TRM 65318]MBE3017811.1 hypothetical protein [Myceligenerans sp. TRM 65318]